MTDHIHDSIDEALLLRAVAPRPLVWVTTRNVRGSGLNMAPFSAVTIVSADPPTLLLIVQPCDDGGRKRSARNILERGEFIVNLPASRQLEPLMRSAAPAVPARRRAAVSSTTTTAGTIVNVDRLVGASFALECRLFRHETILRAVDLLFATVLCVHADSGDLVSPGPFLGALGYEWFVSEEGMSFVRQPYLGNSKIDTGR